MALPRICAFLSSTCTAPAFCVVLRLRTHQHRCCTLRAWSYAAARTPSLLRLTSHSGHVVATGQPRIAPLLKNAS